MFGSERLVGDPAPPPTPGIPATQVFTPSDYPTITYVTRSDQHLEARLWDALAIPGDVISVAGPSKSGKTVLIERVVDPNNLIPISGAGVASGDHLWNRILDWMGSPSSQSRSESEGTGVQLGGEASGGLQLPLVAKGEAKVTGNVSGESSTGTSSTMTRQGMTQVINEIGNSDFVLLIDDFHYMDRGVQQDVARQIKAAAEAGVKVCVASVPHRSDDMVRSNPELRGRVQSINLSYWSPDDLKEIAERGFGALNLVVDKAVTDRFAEEASGSPQLMQAMCLECCLYTMNRTGARAETAVTLSDAQLAEILSDTTSRADYSSLVRRLHNGPKVRGVERKEHEFADRSVGDVYRAVLLAIADNPPALSFDYGSLLRRVESVCVSDPPRPQSIVQACYQLGEIADGLYPDHRVIEWDADESLLEIIDPYLLFHLRHSDQLTSLADR